MWEQVSDVTDFKHTDSKRVDESVNKSSVVCKVKPIIADSIKTGKTHSKESASLSMKQVKVLLGVPSGSKGKDFRVDISPNTAEVILKYNNKKNRNISMSKVSLYAKDMISGNWSADTIDSIAFDSKGILINGQHRLKAIVKSGQTINALVSFGVSPHMGMDAGKTRSIKDNAIMFDDCDSRLTEKKYSICLSVLKNVVRFSTGKYISNPNLTQYDYINLANKYADDFITLIDNGLFSSISVGIGGGKRRQITCASVFSAYFLAYKNGVSLDVLKHIHSTLSDVSNSSSYDKPILALRDVLLSVIGGGYEPDWLRHCSTQYCISQVEKKSRNKVCKSEEIIYTYDLY